MGFLGAYNSDVDGRQDADYDRSPRRRSTSFFR
jgi:hypothetical protein